MKNTIIAILICAAFILTQCQGNKDKTFLITKNSIGRLEKTSLARDLAVIFDQDSIVKDSTTIIRGFDAKKIDIYEKGGSHLLTLTTSSDSIPTIENVRIQDPRFETEEGIGLNSTFKDVKEKYTISKIVTSINNVIVFIKDSDLYFTIDKKELPSNVKYRSDVQIEEVQIPDNAKLKYMMLGWK